MKFVVLNREHFFEAMRLLYNPAVPISRFGELWVELWLNSNQLATLSAQRIPWRNA